MRAATPLGALAVLASLCGVSADAPARQKGKRSLAEDAKALQGTWDMPPKKGTGGKPVPGLRLEVRGKVLTVLAYAKAGDPRGGDLREVKRPFALKEQGGKRLIENTWDEAPMFNYKLDGERLTVTSEKWLRQQLGKEWKLPDKNLLKKTPKSK
jgi:hypothetical protein